MTGPPSIPGAVVLISGDDHNGKSSLVDGFIHGKLTSNGYTPWRNLVADARLPMDEPLTFGRIDEDYGESESETFSLSSGWKDWNKVHIGLMRSFSRSIIAQPFCL
jgi:GTPase SAR1 family protein